MPTNYGNIIHRTLDDSYVINNNTYHVPNEGEWVTQWAEVHAYALANLQNVTQEVPPPGPTEDELQTRWASAVRSERDARIAATDYLVMPDYPAPSETVRASWMDYRQTLRDITGAKGFPWTGVTSAPWPVPPAPIKIQEDSPAWMM